VSSVRMPGASQNYGADVTPSLCLLSHCCLDSCVVSAKFWRRGLRVSVLSHRRNRTRGDDTADHRLIAPNMACGTRIHERPTVVCCIKAQSGAMIVGPAPVLSRAEWPSLADEGVVDSGVLHRMSAIRHVPAEKIVRREV
jgi:hypothetical protein